MYKHISIIIIHDRNRFVKEILIFHESAQIKKAFSAPKRLHIIIKA